MTTDLQVKISGLHGPILVLGASGFVGCNLFRMLLKVRHDVFGTASKYPAWRLEGLPPDRVLACDLLAPSSLHHLLDSTKPLTVFNCVAYGAYSFERDIELIYRTNLNLTVRVLEELVERDIHAYIHAGTSSEYGAMAAAPVENQYLCPNSHYAASKAACSGVIGYMGRERALSCINLRFYSIYGPFEDASRLIPTVVERASHGMLPKFVDENISRDFVYVDDACEAFVAAALRIEPDLHGSSINIGTGRCTTIGEVARTAVRVFGLDAKPDFSLPSRDWDVPDWYADPARAKNAIGWGSRVSFEDGLMRTFDWIRQLDDPDTYIGSSKEFGVDRRYSVSAIVAVYRDAEAIPHMYERLTDVFERLRVEYEIIFVNDSSPDASEEIIRAISSRDHRVIGISHSRNFGSQAAFWSGLEVATMSACVLLDGDLQDPPELIEQFVEKWREGADVVFGRRVGRDAPWYLRIAFTAFYRVFDTFSYVKIPRDAGDFSLIDRRVVNAILQFPERDLFIRGIRAFVGFQQVGVDYERPKRMYGKSTNSLVRYLGWAKKGILSFSNVPLNVLSGCGVLSLGVFAVLALLQVVTKLAFPSYAPKGLTTVILIMFFFGSLNLFAISVIGDYISRIFEEVKRRPRYLRRSVIRDGEIRDASQEVFGAWKDQG